MPGVCPAALRRARSSRLPTTIHADAEQRPGRASGAGCRRRATAISATTALPTTKIEKRGERVDGERGGLGRDSRVQRQRVAELGRASALVESGRRLVGRQPRRPRRAPLTAA